MNIFSYLNVSRWIHPDKTFYKNIAFSFKQHVCLTCTAFEFKLAFDTGPAKMQACSVTCDLCKPTKFKWYRSLLPYVGVGHLINCVHALLPF